MANKTVKSLFFTQEEKTEEEKKKEKSELHEEYNPFLLKNKGKGQQHKDFGHSIKPNSIDYYGWDGALRIVIDDFGVSVEKHYYYFINFFTSNSETFFGQSLDKDEIIKLKDVFDASVSSAFHGQIGSKISAVQQQVSTYLTQIGQLTKTLLPMVREIRMMDERLAYYDGSFTDKPDDYGAIQNEITLKSTWVEVVEQGMQNPNSVYSMATKLGFVTLPDLFFSTNPHGKTPEEQIKNKEKTIEAMYKQYTFNKKVRDALTKKITQYYTWKAKTYQEMGHTRKFRLKAMKQHYNVINLYTSWLKPQMTTLKALQMRNKPDSYELVGSFESSKLELELLFILGKGKKSDWRSCLLVRIDYATRPDLHYAQGGQRQPVHVGKVSISIEPYVATKEDIKWYQDYTDKEVLQYISGGDVDFGKSVDDVLKSLGEDVEDYLKEAMEGKKKKKDKEKKAEDLGLFDPFVGLFDIFKIFKSDEDKKKLTRSDKDAIVAEKKKLAGKAATFAWITYDVFKKQNGMMTPA